MRRTFAEVLRQADIDVAAEYRSLCTMFFTNFFKSSFGSVCPYKAIASEFSNMDIRDTAVSITDFNDRHGFRFQERPAGSIDVDSLVMLCEYITNMLISYCCVPGDNALYSHSWILKLEEQIERVIERIGYERISDGNLVSYIEKSPAARLVAETLPGQISYKVIEYNHHSMKGDLDKKRATLNELAKLLEPRRSELKAIDGNLESKLFKAFNNCDIRHNNRDCSGKSFREAVAALDDREIETAYDATYVLCLIAFLKLDNDEQLEALNELLSNL